MSFPIEDFSMKCNGFEISFVSAKHVGEDDILFTNHLVGKWEIAAEVMECYHSA